LKFPMIAAARRGLHSIWRSLDISEWGWTAGGVV
jgi:hypothetical protein